MGLKGWGLNGYGLAANSRLRKKSQQIEVLAKLRSQVKLFKEVVEERG